MLFKLAQKIANHLGYFCEFLVSLKFQKSPYLVTLAEAEICVTSSCKYWQDTF